VLNLAKPPGSRAAITVCSFLIIGSVPMEYAHVPLVHP
jgi:hypothetical protein